MCACLPQLFGLIPAEVIGRHFKDLVVENDEIGRLVDLIAHADADAAVGAEMHRMEKVRTYASAFERT